MIRFHSLLICNERHHNMCDIDTSVYAMRHRLFQSNRYEFFHSVVERILSSFNIFELSTELPFIHFRSTVEKK